MVMDVYFERIRPLFDGSGKGDAELEREIGIPAKKIGQWNARFTKSYSKYIPQIASYFHVSTDYLLARTDEPSPSGQNKPAQQEAEAVRPNKKELLSEIADMTEGELGLLLEKARNIKKSR